MSDSLATAETVSLTTRSESWETIFQMFRIVFDGMFCQRRKIYWAEQKWGNTILREVADLKRASKKDDVLVATIPGSFDPDAVRLVIANHNRGQILTGIRWEIYRDFGLGELALSGRFDHIDLMMDIPRAKLQRMADQQIAGLDRNPVSWDFDGILTTHRCGYCGSQIDKHFLVFDPEFQHCKKCTGSGREKDSAGSSLVRWDGRAENSTPSLVGLLATASQLLNRLRAVKHVHQVETWDAASPHQFIDVHATPLFCWFFSASGVIRGTPFIDLSDRALPGTIVLGPKAMEDCYRMSVFPLLKQSMVSNAFIQKGFAYYSRRIAEVRVRDFQIPGLDAEQRESLYRPCRIGEWVGHAYAFRDRVETLSRLDDWMYGPGFPMDKWAAAFTEQQARLMKAAESFPFDMENLIEGAYMALKEKT